MNHVIVPVKALDRAKSRLASVLSPAERRALVLAMLGDVLAALGSARTVGGVSVVSRDPAALALAARQGAEPLFDFATDLNEALAQATTRIGGMDAALLVLHADLPLVQPSEIDALIGLGDDGPLVVLAPSHDGGTNALYLRPASALPFRFGEGSLVKHMHAARDAGLNVRLFRAPGLELDVDRPDDLLALADRAGTTAAQRLVRDFNVCGRVACA